jgi:nicotinamidase-related amidase
MDIKSSVLVVVDVENGFVNDENRHVIEPISDLVFQWKEAGGDIVFTRFINEPGGQYERLISWSKVANGPETEIVDELIPHAKLVLEKNFYSFFNDEGRRLAEQHGWKTFVICGIATDSCVLKTAIDAFELGYTPIVVTDAVASHAGDEVHKAGLHLIGRNIGSRQLMTKNQLLSLLPQETPAGA